MLVLGRAGVLAAPWGGDAWTAVRASQLGHQANLRGDHRFAALMGELAVSSSATHLNGYRVWAEALRRRGNLSKARDVLQQGLSSVRIGGRATLLVDLAALEFDAGHHVEAEGLLARALEFAPDHPRIVYGLGQAAAAQGRREDARRLYIRARELSPQDPRPARALAELAEADNWRVDDT